MDLRFGILQLRCPPNISSPLWFTSGFFKVATPHPSPRVFRAQGRARMAEMFGLL